MFLCNKFPWDMQHDDESNRRTDKFHKWSRHSPQDSQTAITANGIE